MQLEFLQMKVLFWTILCGSQSMMAATQKFKLLHYEDYQILWFFGQWGLQVTIGQHTICLRGLSVQIQDLTYFSAEARQHRPFSIAFQTVSIWDQ